MMEFMVEILITTFAFGGILGAVVALHLSANLKDTVDARASASATIELTRNEEPTELKPVTVDITSRRATGSNQHHR